MSSFIIQPNKSWAIPGHKVSKQAFGCFFFFFFFSGAPFSTIRGGGGFKSSRRKGSRWSNPLAISERLRLHRLRLRVSHLRSPQLRLADHTLCYSIIKVAPCLFFFRTWCPRFVLPFQHRQRNIRDLGRNLALRGAACSANPRVTGCIHDRFRHTATLWLHVARPPPHLCHHPPPSPPSSSRQSPRAWLHQPQNGKAGSGPH